MPVVSRTSVGPVVSRTPAGGSRRGPIALKRSEVRGDLAGRGGLADSPPLVFRALPPSMASSKDNLLEASRGSDFNHQPCSASRLLLWTLRFSAILAAALFGLSLYFWIGFHIYGWGSSLLQRVLDIPLTFVITYSVWMWCSTLLGFCSLKYYSYPALASTIKGQQIMKLFITLLIPTILFECVSIAYTYAITLTFQDPSGNFSALEILIADIFNYLFFDNATRSFSGMIHIAYYSLIAF